ncbi:AtpZ/AtpI family protein [Amphibacillus sp. MSJ-3]|uniref:AtpZ/AtpI family protein n=1 Tax=Amphibacillus sp. MSJ-3 TaxID=2841505 RepID=UPI001C0EF8C8|nr:AtpZ/AtpI family protein [Amphibacillus sp. MSJ-3]MBU5595472.1 AtpZ/AtpI family protein [Amphibacillus sp. MSJ-3]
MGKEHNRFKRKNSDTLRMLANVSQIGVTMGASVLIGVLLGKYLDRLLDTSPWLLLIFSLLGAGAAIKSLFNIPKS